MYKTILVPIDLANPAKGPGQIETAKKLGDKNTRIVMCNVIEDVPTFIASQLPGGLLDTAKDESAKDLAGLAKDAGIDADSEIRVGQPGTAILDVAEETGADLIVIASHRPGMQDYLLGSTAARVVRHAQCSVLVTR